MLNYNFPSLCEITADQPKRNGSGKSGGNSNQEENRLLSIPGYAWFETRMEDSSKKGKASEDLHKFQPELIEEMFGKCNAERGRTKDEKRRNERSGKTTQGGGEMNLLS